MRNVIVTFPFIGTSSVSVSFFQTGYFRNHICNTFSAVFDARRLFTGGNFLNSHPNVQMHSSYIHIYILQFHSHRFHKYHESHSNQLYICVIYTLYRMYKLCANRLRTKMKLCLLSTFSLFSSFV